MTTVETDLTKEEHQQLVAKAREEGVSVQELVHRAIMCMLRADTVDTRDPVFKVVVGGPFDDDTVARNDQYLIG
jgi:ADP-ribosylglycohydrolase